MWDSLFSSVDLIKKGVNACWLRNEVIGNNIANVDTPGFKASDVEFESLTAAALGDERGELTLRVSDERHITRGGAPAGQAGVAGQVEARVVTDNSTSVRMDENNVNIENEMAELAKNSIEYYALVSKLNSEFRKLDTAVNVK